MSHYLGSEYSSTIIEDIKAIVHTQPGTSLSFFYFDIKDKTKQTFRNLLSSLVLGLVAKSKKYLLMENLYQRHDQIHSPTDDELKDLFMDLLQGFNQAYVVIDALDECLEHELLPIFEMVKSILERLEMSHCHLLVSSRREKRILDTLMECNPIDIYLSPDLVGGDIASYIHFSIRREQKFRRWDAATQHHIEEMLINGAHGMYVSFCLYLKNASNCPRFHWVVCQIEELKACLSYKDLMDALTHLPKDLETIYNQILQRINAREMSYAKIILWWLMLGLQPLTIQELSIVVMFNPITGLFDSTLGLAQPEDVMQACSSLITSTDGNIVTLAHASVKEYFLVQPRPWNNDLIDLSDTQIGHAMIAYLCLKYLFQADWNTDHSSKKFPLEHYSVKHWPDHYKHSDRNLILQDTVVKFFQMDQGCEGPYITWVNLHHHAQLYSWDFDGELSPFFHAGHLGLDDIIQCLILDGTWSVIYDKTLNVAALEGHINIIKILLDNGANVTVKNDLYGNALHSASLKGHGKIVKLFLKRGVDVNAQGGR